ncbi:hypothetical protein EAJ14_02790 [Parabacteroides distasonis]|uniref:Uncharacterized protein n=9 Tax=Bacteroidales TaxID=171549 RepID=A0A414PN86_BACSE|nr:hypothetical protein BACCOP_01735 [Phocaeicola coprocola DSM 17136]EEZ21186.1 hypothetical protein HMPREF0105_2969 [Bacteroides sp. 3_1_33FAA]EXY25133.1 hypothetical protein M078_4472 [Bacteroides fragilis str. 2-F-2 \
MQRYDFIFINSRRNCGKRLKGFYCCFRKNGCINRAVLKEIFADILSEKQVREFISKTEDAGIIQKKGDW